MSLRLGDVVVDRTGGPRMTVVRFPVGTDLAECAWWRGDEADIELSRRPISDLAAAPAIHGVYAINRGASA